VQRAKSISIGFAAFEVRFNGIDMTRIDVLTSATECEIVFAFDLFGFNQFNQSVAVPVTVLSDRVKSNLKCFNNIVLEIHWITYRNLTEYQFGRGQSISLSAHV